MGRHKTYRGMARDLYPRVEWIAGEGEWALVADCGRATTITLWDDPQRAVEECRAVNRFGGGGRCVGNHFVGRLSMTPNGARLGAVSANLGKMPMD